MKKLYFVLLLSLISGYGTAQDTVSIMYYNLLKFPDINSSRINDLEEIVSYYNPDIFVVCELTSAAGAS